MTSSNGNIFRVTGPLCGEFNGPGEFPTQRPVTQSFDPWGWWFETPSWSLWRQCNDSHPSHHGHKKIIVMVMNDQLILLSFHVNRLPIVGITLFYFFTLKIQFNGQRESHIVAPASNWFASFLFHINQTNNSWDRAISKPVKNLRSRSWWGQRSRSHS